MGYYYFEEKFNYILPGEAYELLKRGISIEPTLKGRFTTFSLTGSDLLRWIREGYELRALVPPEVRDKYYSQDREERITRRLERAKNIEVGKAIYKRDTEGVFHTCWLEFAVYDMLQVRVVLGSPSSSGMNPTEVRAVCCECERVRKIVRDLFRLLRQEEEQRKKLAGLGILSEREFQVKKK